MSIVLLFGTSTFWLTTLILMGFKKTRDLGSVAVLSSTVHNGELFIFAVGFIGPILISTAEDKANEKAFPGRLLYLSALIVLGLVATSYNAQAKSAHLLGQLVPEDVEYWFSVSLWVSAFAVVLRYLALVYRKSNFNPEREIHGRQDKFVADYARHRAGDQS